MAMFFIFGFATFDQLEYFLGHLENFPSKFFRIEIFIIGFSVDISFENSSFYFNKCSRGDSNFTSGLTWSAVHYDGPVESVFFSTLLLKFFNKSDLEICETQLFLEKIVIKNILNF